MIQTEIHAGYNGGTWTGTASSGIITSSDAAANPNQLAIGYADWADGTGTDTVANTVEIKCTVMGDANLDGTVNLADLLALARHFGQTNASWDQGNFNYDGSANLSDFLILARHFGQSLPAPTLSASDLLLPRASARRRVAGV